MHFAQAEYGARCGVSSGLYERCRRRFLLFIATATETDKEKAIAADNELAPGVH